MKKLVNKFKQPLFDLCYRILMSGSDSKGVSRTPYGKDELKLLHQALRSQRLFRWSGKMTSRFEEAFAQAYGVPCAIGSTSGTSAIHIALGTLDINEGDEVITSSITDMGTIVPILAQRAVPVFADIDESYTLNPKSVEQCISDRTKAIIVVHVFGNPCNMTEINAIAKKHNILVIEDCAQAHMTKYREKFVGTIGDVGCFSFQESKHLTTGDGGMTISRHQSNCERIQLCADKGFDRLSQEVLRYRFQAPNYRMNELTAAVGLAQLGKVKDVIKRRNQIGSLMTELLSGVNGIRTAPVTEGGSHSYWAYPLYLENISVQEFVEEMKTARVPAAIHMSTPVYFTATSLQSPDRAITFGRAYERGLCPVAESLVDHLVLIWINENWNDAHIQRVTEIISNTLDKLSAK